MSAEDRIYTEEEIGRVLKRAAEIQRKSPHTSGYGLSLGELQDLATESGLDPRHVLSAALELTSDQEAHKKKWWGGPLTSTLIRTVDGEISDETWEDMLSILRRKVKETGTTETRGATRQWMVRTQEGGRAHLIATHRNGRTELELMLGNPAAGIPMYIIPVIGSIIALPIIFEALSLGGFPAFLVWLAVASLLLGVARQGVSWMGNRVHNQTRDLIDRLAATARAAQAAAQAAEQAAEPAAPARERAPAPKVEIPDTEYGVDSERATAPADSRHRRRAP